MLLLILQKTGTSSISRIEKHNAIVSGQHQLVLIRKNILNNIGRKRVRVRLVMAVMGKLFRL